MRALLNGFARWLVRKTLEPKRQGHCIPYHHECGGRRGRCTVTTYYDLPLEARRAVITAARAKKALRS